MVFVGEAAKEAMGLGWVVVAMGMVAVEVGAKAGDAMVVVGLAAAATVPAVALMAEATVILRVEAAALAEMLEGWGEAMPAT